MGNRWPQTGFFRKKSEEHEEEETEKEKVGTAHATAAPRL